MIRTLKLTISYDGTRFVGWQRQAEGVSIQGLLEDALARFEGGPVAVHGAGRTDAGVHALGQVASVRMTSAHTTMALARGLNACLPPDVRVTHVEEAAPEFHARFSARSKTYRYRLCHAGIVSPFERAYVWHVPGSLDLDAMRAAAGVLVGTHDCAAFSSSAKGRVAPRPDEPALAGRPAAADRPGQTSPKRARESGRSTGSDTKDTIRTITRSELIVGSACTPWPQETSGHTAKASVAYEISGNGFLRHMVRAVVGTLVEIGRGRRPAASMAELLAGGSRAEAGATAPPQGLFLVRVDYD